MPGNGIDWPEAILVVGCVRGNGRRGVFHKPGDFDASARALRDAGREVPVRLLAYCLMPNHFHLVAWPVKDGGLSRWMHWLTTAHVRRYHEHYHTTGHVRQGRFKAFPVQGDGHLLAVIRHVEHNPVRVGLCGRSADWPWSSARWRGRDRGPAQVSSRWREVT